MILDAREQGPRDIAGYDPARDAGSCRFDPVAAAKAVGFFHECLVHVKGALAGQHFELEPWQRDIIACLFGWKRLDGTRRYRQAYIFIPRKNGKSTLAAGIALYTLYCDKEAGAECYCAASDKDQAGLVYSMAASMVRKCPPLAKNSKVRDSVKRIIYGDSFLRAIPANEGGAHGFNVHCLIGDELHAWEGTRGREFRDVLHTGTGARSQPLEVYITTAGFDRLSVCYEVDRYAKQVRDGQITDQAFLPAYYAAEEADDWTDPDVWAKANPNLGVSVSTEYIAAECEKAKQNPRYENTFRRLHLNQWTSQEVRWLPMDKWRKCAWTTDDFDLTKPVYGGLDLSQTCDLTAWVLCQKLDDKLRVRAHYFMPGGRLEEYERRDGVPYFQWIKDGRITAPPGESINYDYLHERILADSKKYQLEFIGFDPYNATQTTLFLEGEGLQMVTVRQGAATLSAPMKDLERLVAEGLLDHGNDPVLEWMAENVEIVIDTNANIRPVKSERTRSKKIDGIVALIMSLCVCNSQADQTSIYEQPGALSL
jgi:phage terminase large subunit-like protein